MKKEQVKIQVLRKMTKNDIRNYGGNLWLRQKFSHVILWFAISLAWMLVIAQIFEGNWGSSVAMLPMVIWLIIIVLFMDKAGKNYWSEVKDKTQPVDLG